jgi:hypothetical protein
MLMVHVAAVLRLVVHVLSLANPQPLVVALFGLA